MQPLSARFQLPITRLGEYKLADLEALRVILFGGSVIDWKRLSFDSEMDAVDFLRVNLLDPYDPFDAGRLNYLHKESIRYLEHHFHWTFDDQVKRPGGIQELLMLASRRENDPLQKEACSVLKVMDVIQHIDARELVYNAAISDAVLAEQCVVKVRQCVNQMKEAGLGIDDHYGGPKTRDSTITKLLSKKTATASRVFDRVRFRIITKTPDDIIPVIDYLRRALFPFNYVLPGESHNNLVDFYAWIENQKLGHLIPEMQQGINLEQNPLANSYSSRGYRTVNFIAELPLAIDRLAESPSRSLLQKLGRIIYYAVEFQIIDRATHVNNEQGDNSHDIYKLRQRQGVLARLGWEETPGEEE
ncbi:MAG: hypothetical protein GMKNLPBB_00224 [Myxococcota bacterium]|nr:hypothetical protein [Myxococcota bacterium]